MSARRDRFVSYPMSITGQMRPGDPMVAGLLHRPSAWTTRLLALGLLMVGPLATAGTPGLLTDSGVSAGISSAATDTDKADFGKKSVFDSKAGSKIGGVLGGSPVKFLPADQAFHLVAEPRDGKLILSFQVTPGYYLYQRKFGYLPEGPSLLLGDASFSHPSQIKDDPEFGKVPVYHDDVTVTVPYSGSGKVTVRWQGCAEAGLCYPPQDRDITLPQATGSSESALSAGLSTALLTNAEKSEKATSSNNTNLSLPNLGSHLAGNDITVASGHLNLSVPMLNGRPDIRTNLEKSAGVQSILIPLPTPNSTSDSYAYGVHAIAPWANLHASPHPAASQPATTEPTPEPTVPEVSSTADAMAGTTTTEPMMPPAAEPVALPETAPATNPDPFGLGQHPLTAFLLLFLAGLGLAFTPCVLPMVPIVANLVARQHRRSLAHGFALSAAYGVGVASCYAVVGALVAVFGQQINLLGWLQRPSVLLTFAVLFALLALASFDVFTIRLPHAIQSRIDGWQASESRVSWLKSGRLAGSWLTGFLSALVVSPCVSAPLAGVLLSVSTVGSPWLGAVALFCLGLGLSVPLMILGATEGRFLPKSGEWLNWVRQGFGLLLLGVSLVLINRVFDNMYMLLLWAALSMALAVWFWHWAGGGRFVTRVLAVILAAWGLVQLAGFAAGQTDPWHPLAGLRQDKAAQCNPPVTVTIHSVAELAQARKQYPHLLIDLTADWCVSCRIMERELFSGQDIKGLSSWTRVRLDITDSNADSKAVIKSLKVFGPPALIFYQDGREVGRLVGETNADTLTQALAKL